METQKVYNLHNHTFYSDGILSPAQVVEFNKRQGHSVIAITDHDSIEGIKEAIEAGQKLGITVIPGVELSTKNFELLGLFIDHNNPQLKEFLEYKKQYKADTLKATVAQLQEKGFRVTTDSLNKFAGCAFITEEAIANYLISTGQARNRKKILRLIRARPIRKPEQGFPRNIYRTSIRNAAQIITEAGGIPVLSHPFAYGAKTNFVTLPFIIFFMRKWGVKGLETQNPKHNKLKSAFLRVLSKTFKMYQSGGLDLHKVNQKSLKRWVTFKSNPKVMKLLREKVQKGRIQ